jgi:hypothetical protein
MPVLDMSSTSISSLGNAQSLALSLYGGASPYCLLFDVHFGMDPDHINQHGGF